MYLETHEIKRCLLLGRKVMTNLDSIFKSRDITLPTKVYLVKAMVFPVVMYGCESWTVKKAEHRRIDWASLMAQTAKSLLTNPGSMPGFRRSPGEGNDYPLQYSCLENSMDRGAFRLHSMGSQTVGHD